MDELFKVNQQIIEFLREQNNLEKAYNKTPAWNIIKKYELHQELNKGKKRMIELYYQQMAALISAKSISDQDRADLINTNHAMLNNILNADVDYKLKLFIAGGIVGAVDIFILLIVFVY